MGGSDNKICRAEEARKTAIRGDRRWRGKVYVYYFSAGKRRESGSRTEPPNRFRAFVIQLLSLLATCAVWNLIDFHREA